MLEALLPSVQAPAKPKSFSDIMNGAADLIEKRGKAQSQLYDSQNRLCTFAAVYEAVEGKRLHEEGYHGTSSHLRLARWLGVSICFYNNRHTEEEVVTMLRRAAVEA